MTAQRVELDDKYIDKTESYMKQKYASSHSNLGILKL